MAVANGISTKEYGNDKQIMIAPELMVSYSGLVGNQGVTADSEGRKIIKAGTPVGAGGDFLRNRDTVLTKGADNLQGIVLHDVDVTAGDTNAAIVVEGDVDILKLDGEAATILNMNSEKLPKIRIVTGYNG